MAKTRTPKQRAALRKAQLASARKRRKGGPRKKRKLTKWQRRRNTAVKVAAFGVGAYAGLIIAGNAAAYARRKGLTTGSKTNIKMRRR